MVMRKRGALAWYRDTPAAIPAAMDAFILAAARDANRRPNPRIKLLAIAMTAIMATAMVERWMSPGDHASRAPFTRDFGMTEGNARAYLSTLEPPANTGPGSLEGLP